jgi:predicted DNA-binding transcriptional regulator YafY
MFTRDEIVALVAGARMVRACGAAMTHTTKRWSYRRCTPEAEKIASPDRDPHAHVGGERRRSRSDRPDRARRRKRQVLTIDYSDEAGQHRARHSSARPVVLGKVWTHAWCEMRDDFRAFRIDRIASVVIAGRVFKPERGKQLADFYRAVERSEDYGIAPDRAART